MKYIHLLVVLLVVLTACVDRQERLRRLLVDPKNVNAYKSWNLAVLYTDGDTLPFKNKQVLLFLANGTFEECFWCSEHRCFEAHSCPTGLPSDVIPLPVPHKWNFGNPGELLLMGDTAIVEKITKDSLVLRDYPVENGRAVYLLKTDHTNIDFFMYLPHAI